jgi:hypothetical protein
MNFFAHATVALWRSQDSGFVLGAMLPDLFGMLGLRVRDVADPEISAGIAFHHATDGAFHAAPAFAALSGRVLAKLEEQGVGRGSARGVAHVGVELLLDGALSHDAQARSAYRSALTSPSRTRIAHALGPDASDQAERLHAGLQRLALAPVPEGYRDADFAFERVRNLLARRPRLALRDADLEAVRRVLHATRPAVERACPLLLEQVRERLPAQP